LKPGGLFAAYEWCMTEKYNPNDPIHQEIKHNIAEGDALPDIASTKDVLRAMEQSGFEIIRYEDLAPLSDRYPVAWYEPLVGRYDGTLQGLKCSYLGRVVTGILVRVLETLRLAPPGTTKTHSILMKAAKGLVDGGRNQTFTPMFYFIARKPIHRK